MKKLLYLILLFLISSNAATAQSSMVNTPDKDEYRRSSLSLILLTHRDKKYAEAMQRVFLNFPLPARYNDHNITGVRVISVSGKQSKKKVDDLLKTHAVARKIVSQWFNYNPGLGTMDMDLIHERGGYGASFADYQRSQMNVRGTDMLKDEGVELLQSSFVLVCDMDYIDKKKGAAWGAFGLALLGAGMAGVSQANYNQAQKEAANGNYSAAQKKMNDARAWNAGSSLAMVGSAVVADIGGFRVKMNAYLYKLNWNDVMTQTIFRDYWIDETFSEGERQSRKDKFEHSFDFSLSFLGEYKASSSKTILRSWNNEDEVILDVCQRCVNKGVVKLAKEYPIFRPRTPFYFDGVDMYSHIGRKEDVTYGCKFEIVQPYKDKHGQICYKRVGKATAGSPWNNTEIRFDQYFDENEKGTKFYYDRASVDVHTHGLQLREY